ncbi:MerR family transcriptional regulator [Mycolicibacterium setense]|uniref:MerR family transcriptional regulator n=1 Tax=Mycolicibacterium setense TaxID=431269 RepID=A0ABR4YVQ8_9MYCO|nr:MerR family DNA-binding transcriptional regulator [Mycolicibacterium setense]KHO26268.1 MerR family transcriptional regulator [Mycolicibacterium setense]
MRIGELARRTGVSQRSLRYYEQQGLLASERTPGGQREYSEKAIDRVIRTRSTVPVSGTISSLLPCMRDADGGPAAEATPRLLDALSAGRDRIEQAIRELSTSREILDGVIDASSG